MRTYAILVMATVMLGGCSWSVSFGGSDTDTKAHGVQPRPTVGQELLDLQAARDAGAIGDQEYERQRRRILNRH